jgi:hypothetical protein
VHEIEVGDGREPSEPVLESGQFKPGREEAGSLCALSGRDDDEHVTTLAYWTTFPGTGADEANPVPL